jgi:hypothetical protein
MIVWEAESLRLTALSPSLEPGPDVWERVHGAPPDESAKNRVQRIFEERGDVGALRLTYKSSPGRADWIATARSGDASMELLPRIDLATGSGVLRSIAEKWLPEATGAARLAFGAVLSLPVATREAGYAQIAELLQTAKPDPASEDFLLQINWPRYSKTVADLKINRMTKWAVARTELVQFIAGSAVVQHEAPSFWCRLELDINTDGKRDQPLPTDRIVSLWNELADLGSEIAQKGEVK